MAAKLKLDINAPQILSIKVMPAKIRTPISFEVSDDAHELIRQIVRRADKLNIAQAGKPIDRLSLDMDLCACIAQGQPLRLADLLAADDFNFTHDVFGIIRHMDRRTGKLKDCFLPRYHA